MAWKYLFEERAEERGMLRGMARGEELGREAGIRLGREEGREEGRLDAVRQLLCAQLAQRFGQFDDEVVRRVEGASLAEVERWCLAVVTARTIDEIF